MTVRIPRPIDREPPGDLPGWFPPERPIGDEQTFEIALVLAGAQSAGCYLGGVLDFLFEALDEWHKAKAQAPDAIPNHRVVVRTIVGSSAGGITTAISAIAGPYRFAPAVETDYDKRAANLSSPFYRAWVHDIDIVQLLTTDDIADDKPVRSALNTEYLLSRVDDYLRFTGEAPADPAHRAWLADPLQVSITVSNLAGVHYGVRFRQEIDEDGGGRGHAMCLHRDHLSFQRPMFLDEPFVAIPDHEPLPPQNDAGEPGWARLGEAAIGSIAFPGALSAQSVERPNTDYDYRFVYFEDDRLVSLRPIPSVEPGQTRFPVVDGGVLNNEPFDIAHAVLAGSEGRNPRQGKRAKRAVILVDPFTDPEDAAVPASPRLTQLPGLLYQAFRHQVRFKPIDLALAEGEDVYSRFMIAPARRASGGKIYGDRALASSRLGSFLGYFSEAYRHHDFMLGRRNCQNFLRNWFCLPSAQGAAGDSAGGDDASNTLFDLWPADALANEQFVSPRYPDHRSIIPLVGTAAREAVAPVWPARAYPGWPAVAAPMARRLDALWARLRGAAVGGAVKWRIFRPPVAGIARLYWRISARRRILAALESRIDAAVHDIDRDE